MSRWITGQILQALPGGRKTVTNRALVAATGLTRHQVSMCIQKLKARGLVALPKAGVYRLTPSGRRAKDAGTAIVPGPNGRVPYRRGTFRARLWQALRQQGKATIPDLIELAGTGAEKDADKNAAKYLSALAAAGFVARLPRREPGIAPTSNGHVRWVLIRDTGPKPPTYRERLRSVFDQNTGESHAIGAPTAEPAP